MRTTSSARLPRFTQKLVRFVPAVWYALFVALIVGSWPQAALAQESCTTTQITSSTGGFSENPTINADGTRVAFYSDRNLTGNNSDNNIEIFLFDSAIGTLTEITNTTGGLSLAASINADGTRIAFVSTANLTGGNPDGNDEIVLFDTTTGTFTQITNTTGGFSVSPSINADGTRIAFVSTANLTGGNPDGNDEIVLFDTTTGTFTQITNTTGGGVVQYPQVNASGTRIAFHSDRDLTGGNPIGYRQIFLFDTTTGTLTQITSATNAHSQFPSINADGTHIAFQSEANLSGDNPDGNTEIFLFDTTTDTFTQITNTTGGVRLNEFPSINADGTRIAFASAANLTGGNPDGNLEIFLFDTTTDTFTQITNTTGGVGGISSSGRWINADGTHFAFGSSANPTGGNPDGNAEIFLATCGASTPVITVANTNDSGPGSLRQAIEDANNTPGIDTINFNIPPGGVQRITLTTSPLPPITAPVIIDGTTQPGYSGTPLVELYGGMLSGTNPCSGAGLAISAGNSIVRGLMINAWGAGIYLYGNGGNVVQGNYFGLDATGNLPPGDYSSSACNSGALGSGNAVLITSPNNLIGGTTVGAGNVMTSRGSNSDTLLIVGSLATGNVVQGNLIGTNAAGTAVPQDPHLSDTSLVRTECANNNTIGGTTPGARNIISGSNRIGVLLFGRGNLVQGNFIGTQIDGISPLGNREAGVYIQTGSNCSPEVTKDNTIGGETSGAGNIIAYTLFGPGVAICPYGSACRDTVPVGNKILGNSIFSNATLGIDLGSIQTGADGPTPNDVGDSDTGPNNLQNFPVLTSVSSVGGRTTVQGTLNSTANTTFRVEFFASPACNPSGYGEGKRFLGAQSVTTDSSGNVSFTATLSLAVSAGEFITATATDPANNTSEFSKCTTVNAAGADLAITKVDSPDPVQVDQTLTYTLTATNNGPAGATGVTVTDTLPSGVTFVSASASQGSCSGTSTVTCSLGSLANGASTTVTIVVQPTATGTLTNTASVQGNEADPMTANNTATAVTTVQVSPVACTLYVDDNSYSIVSVIDTATNMVTTTVPVPIGYGVAATPDGTRVYVANRQQNGQNIVSVIDTATNTVVATVSVAPEVDPLGITVAATGAGPRVYVANEGFESGTTVSVIDAATNTVIATVPVAQAPLAVAATMDGTRVWVASTTGIVSAIDTATNTVVATVTLPNGFNSFLDGVAVTPDGARVYAVGGGSNQLFVIDTATNTGTDTGVTGLAYPEGIAVAVNPATPTKPEVYVANHNSNSVSVIDVTTNAVVATVQVGHYPFGVAVNPTGTRVYVANRDSSTLSVIDTATHAVVATVPQVGGQPLDVAVVCKSAAADLALTKTDAPDPVQVGQTLTYTLTATNNGPAGATGVTVSDTLPGGVTLVSASASQGSCSGTSTVTCSLGSLANGASATVTIQVRPTAAGTLTNTASVSGTEADPNSGNNTATASTTVNNPAADLALTKTDAPDPVQVGQTLTYTLTATNNGPAGATGVTVSDTLPGGVTLVSASASQGSCSGTSTVTCSLGSLANGASATVTIQVRPTAAGTLINTASVSGTEADPNSGNNTATASTTVSAAADLALTKTDAPDPVLAGQTLTYTLTATNNGPAGATGVTVSDTLPSGVTFQSASASQGSCSGTSTVTCSLGSLANGASATVTIQVRPTAAGTLTNTASVSGSPADPNSGNNTATATTTVNPAADLALTKADAPDPVQVSQTLTYTLTATNNGPSGATGVTVSDTLPSGVTFVSASASCSGTTTVTCNIGNLANGASATVTITVRPTVAGTLTNTASVSGSPADPNPGNNTATASTTVTAAADLALTKTDAPDPVLAGQPLTYTLTATNSGPSGATGVTVTDTLPGGVTFVSASASQGSCSGTSTVTCSLGSLANGASATVTIQVRPTAAGTLTNTASVSGIEADPNSGNNTVTASTTVNPAADLALTKTDAPDPVQVGQTLTYTLTATNSGPSGATGVTVSDTLPSGVTFQSASASQGSCSGTSTVTCSLGSLANGASATITIVVKPKAAGTLTNTASVQGNEADPITANNTATAVTTVNAGAGATVTVVATDPSAGEAGPDPGVFTITRSGSTSSALTVNFTVGGTATQGTDYNAIGTSVTIPVGQASATVTITPIPDTVVEGPETVILTLAASAGYTVGSPNTATVTIEEGGTWAAKAPMPTARDRLGVAAASNGKLYAIGGTLGEGSSSIPQSKNEEYDPATNTWTTKAPMPTARDGVGVAAASNGKLYAIGGDNDSTGLATNQEYNPTTNTWATKASMRNARTGVAVAAAPNGKVYAMGGALKSGSPNQHTVEEYDPATNTWTTKAPMPTARSGLGLAAASNGKLYAIGGGGGPNVVEEYDPATNTWTTKAPMPTPRGGLVVVAAPNGKLYAIGGSLSGTVLSTVEEYDPATNIWTTMTSMPTSRTWLGGAVAPNGKIYAIGGLRSVISGSLAIKTVEEYTPPQ